MKVGTDALLLGGWALYGGGARSCMDSSSNAQGAALGSPRTLLDVGTGSGVLALMAADALPDAQITAIDTESSAFQQALANVQTNADRM